MDLGLAAKIRPALVISVPPGDTDRALVTVVPHTTGLRGTEFEAVSAVSFLKAGAFDAQGYWAAAPIDGRLKPGILEA